MKNLSFFYFLTLTSLLMMGCDFDGVVGQVNSNQTSTSNSCVEDLIGQLTIEPRLNLQNHDATFAFSYPRIGLSSHVQGIARLRDWNGKGRMVISENGTSDGLRLAFHSVKDAEEGVFSSDQKLGNRIAFPVRNRPEYGDHAHCGGMQAQGDILAIAMEDGRALHGAVYFLRITGDQITYLQTLSLNGSQGEPFQTNQNAAASVGFVQLEDGSYLLAVSGKNHGKQGIWFYQSDGSIIDPNTEWIYLDFFEPTCTEFGENYDPCFVGASGGVNLVTDCSGSVYLVGMHGTALTGGDEYEYLQVFKILINPSNEVALLKMAQQDHSVGNFATNSPSFRWAGGVYSSMNGHIIIFNSERRRNVRDNDFVDGNVYWGKHH